MKPAAVKSVCVGFHVRGMGETGEDCGKPVHWHDSPALSWLECECGASGLDGALVRYGAPVRTQATCGPIRAGGPAEQRHIGTQETTDA
jgi:hypothetical protein